MHEFAREGRRASTSVENPTYPDTRYITDLVAPGVVNAIDRGHPARGRRPRPHPGDSVRGQYADARQVLSLATWRRSAWTPTT